MLSYGLIADDLTGACDAGVQFAMRGLSTIVWLDRTEPLPSADLTVLSTASRQDGPLTAASKVRNALARLGPRQLLFKKVDSTLRGNVVAEVAACGFDEAWIAPAFPAMGRQLIQGRLWVNGIDTGIALQPRPGIRIFDAATQEELAAIASQAYSRNPRPLLAGSAGLAQEVAKLLAGPALARPPAPGRRGPVVLFVGSTHKVTELQVKRLKDCHDPHAYRLVPVKTLEGEIGPRIARFQARDAGGFVMTGGDTAALVCRALGAGGIRLAREIRTGIPFGTLVGGKFDGMPVITKAGGFGEPDTLAYAVQVLLEGK